MSITRMQARRIAATLAGALLMTGCAGSDSGFRQGLQAYDSGRYEQAIEDWADAAEDGSADAQHALGWAYANGLGVERNEAEAVAWYERAAGRGHTGAQVNLAILYDDGIGILAPDPRRAAALFRQAADAGSPEAQNSLGRMYKAGRGVPRDPRQAAVWLERAAKQGYAPAQNSFGLMYLNGEGVRRDPQLAYVWLERAVRQGQPGAELNRDFAAALLDAGEKAEAQALLQTPVAAGG